MTYSQILKLNLISYLNKALVQHKDSGSTEIKISGELIQNRNSLFLSTINHKFLAKYHVFLKLNPFYKIGIHYLQNFTKNYNNILLMNNKLFSHIVSSSLYSGQYKNQY